MSFSDYIVYVDESGDHGLANIDSEYPIFVLALCIFKKTDYISTVTPALQKFKFRYWGHDTVVLHEHEIRKSMHGDYRILNEAGTRKSFLHDLSYIIETSPFHVIAAAINKQEHCARYKTPANPYNLSLLYCLERLTSFLKTQGADTTKNTSLIFESRGKEEDKTLELEFRRIMDGAAPTYMMQPHVHETAFSMHFLSKSANSAGLQLADLIARPIGLKALRPQQPNRAFDIIEPKLFVKNGTYNGHGLKIFP